MNFLHYSNVKIRNKKKNSNGKRKTGATTVLLLFLGAYLNQCLLIHSFDTTRINLQQRQQQQLQSLNRNTIAGLSVTTSSTSLFSSTIRRVNNASIGSKNTGDDKDDEKENTILTPQEGMVHVKEKSNFWKTVVETEKSSEDKSSTKNEKLSSVPWLDVDGPLPSFAYQTLAGGVVHEDRTDRNELLQTCRISIGIDLTNIGIENVQQDEDSEDEGNHHLGRRRPTRPLQKSTTTTPSSSSYWSCNSKIEPKDICKDMQQFMDSGLTTFAFKTQTAYQQQWGEYNVLRRLQQTTPKSVLRNMHVVHPLSVPRTKHQFDQLRETLVSSLYRMKTDYMDTLQLHYNPTSPYHYDTLDFLQELQRDGLVRSVAGQNMPLEVVQTAYQYGFRMDSNQITCHMMDSSAYKKTPQLFQALIDMSEKEGDDDYNSSRSMKLRLASPLAGGLLTDQFTKYGHEPPPSWEMSPSSLHAMKTILPQWYSHYKQRPVTPEEMERQQHPSATPLPSSLWGAYQRYVVDTVTTIAQKHGVSQSSVALRWAMQLDHTATVVTSCTLGRRMDTGLPQGKNRSTLLRQVFTFELDHDDMDQLWKLSGGKPPTYDNFNSSNGSLLDFDNLSEDDYERFLL